MGSLVYRDVIQDMSVKNFKNFFKWIKIQLQTSKFWVFSAKKKIRKFPKPLKVPSLSPSVPRPLKVPSLAPSVSKPLKVPSLARSVPMPLKVGQTLVIIKKKKERKREREKEKKRKRE